MVQDLLKDKIDQAFPTDSGGGIFVGRIWIPEEAGPSPVVAIDGKLYDFSRVAPTSSQLLNTDNPVAFINETILTQWVDCIGSVDDFINNCHPDLRNPQQPFFLSPCDLQAIRACGVTFVSSMVERVIEEFAKGQPDKSAEIRHSITKEVGDNLKNIVPGSEMAEKLKVILTRQGLWSQYLEVGIGPDAEVFNKAQPMSSVGLGAEIGIRSDSSWNNPEPEVVLAINRAGKIIGATIGNDVNLRDFEGRSALLLGKAKDNNASCALGPFVRLLDGNYTMEDLCNTKLIVNVDGPDGYSLSGVSDFSKISRAPIDLANQAINRTHQYPDGVMLFLGTQFAPTHDRDQPGKGFTHKKGDVVSIACDHLGTLVNRVNFCEEIPPWSYGITDLWQNLVVRGLI